MVEQHTRKPQVCKFFPSGRCRFGDRCRFSHDLGAGGGATEVGETAKRGQTPGSSSYARLRAWKFKIPRDTLRILPLGSDELQVFLTTALDLVTSDEPDIVQQVVESLASNGGLARISEAVTTAAAPSSDRQCLQNGEYMLLPLFNVLTHPDVTQSFILEKPLSDIYCSLYGGGGRRAVSCFSAAARFLSLFDPPSAEKSKAVVAVLTCLHNVIELVSNAKLDEGIHAVVKTLAKLLKDELKWCSGAQRLFQRIEDRLQEGTAMPIVDYSHNTSAVVPLLGALHLERDQPGQLSSKGARHDNDHDDISRISVLPTASEVLSERAEYLPVRDPRHLHLGGVKGLLDRHFRLLREDTIGQLRDSVRAEIDTLRDPSAPELVSSKLQQNIRRFAYKDVKLMKVTFARVTGLQAHLSFPQPKPALQKSEQIRRQWWEQSKRLCPDALLCLVDAAQNVTFFTVCGYQAGGGASDTISSKLLYQDPLVANVIVRLVEPYELDIERLVTSLSSPTSGARVLCEFPGVLLPSFYPTLKALQKMSQTLDLPFADIIAPTDTNRGITNVGPAPYAMKSGFKFDLKSIVGNEHLELSVADRFDFATLAANSSLDEAQQTAVVDALARKLALIQGPPGTGKSFTGVALIKVLLDNASKARLGPIVCVCYTNHALDQLLEHLVKDDIEGIIRIGSRSKSDIVQRLNLREAMQSEARTSTEKRHFGSNKAEIERYSEEMKPLLEDLMNQNHPKIVRNLLQRKFPEQHRQLYEIEKDDEGFEIVDNDSREPLIKWLHPKWTKRSLYETRVRTVIRPLDLLKHADVRSMALQERLKLYEHWIQIAKEDALAELSWMLSTVGGHVEELAQCRKEDELRALAKAKVIGVTTSGLARNLDVLRRVQAKVMVCEEAGEVLEAHLLTALLPSVEHAILIGDHRQLKPQIANYELSSENPRGVQYSLDISLFERLLYPNDPQAAPIPYSALRTQRRMHPSIARLIRETLYPGLVDEQSVHEYPAVEGMKSRLFWFDHDHPENSDERRESTSYTNDFEIEMTAALVHHLVRQSRYNSEDIAVLTPYLGQLIRLRNRLASSFEIVVGDRDQAVLEQEGFDADSARTSPMSTAKKTSLSKAVRIATVDNFQGEEAKVVIVSLVRSNQERRCGFLKTSNRINVLLSRAQHGMYLFGDSSTYKHVKMWQHVIQLLEDSNSLGKSLALRCPRHPDTAIEVATPDDFAVKAPEGGCDLMCDRQLPCGHRCINKCHHTVLHQEVFCHKPCPRALPGCDHACPLPCGATCGPCKVQFHNVKLRCGHVEASLDCYLAQNPIRATCRKIVQVKVPLCGHTAEKRCCEPDPGPNYQCMAECGGILPCGHECGSKCHMCKPREDGTIIRIDHASCSRTCKRLYTTCSHYCKEACHPGSDCPLCSRPCEVRCAHSRCAKPCKEPCAPCAEDCTWGCPHTGKCDLPCAVPCSKVPCSRRCESILACGHQCPSVCGETCPSTGYCQTCCPESTKDIMVDYLLSGTYGETNLDEDPCLVPDCGHLMTMSSMDGVFGLTEHYETNNDGTIIALKRSSVPFSAEGIKACPVCRGSLRNINRYSRIIRRSMIDEATKRFIAWSNTEIIKHADRLHTIQEQFAADQDIAQLCGDGDWRTTPDSELNRQSDTMILKGHRAQVMADISRIKCLKSRHKQPYFLRQQLNKFLHEVQESEQPFVRVWDLLQNRRRRDLSGHVNTDLIYEPSVVQLRASLMSLSLSIRFDVTIIADALSLRKRMNSLGPRYHWAAIDLDVDFSQLRAECLNLVERLAAHQQHRLEIETRVSFAHLAALERSAIGGSPKVDRLNYLRDLGLEQLKYARGVHARYPSQTSGVIEELDAIELMLNDGTFYNAVTSEEQRAIYKAMSAEFRGTGHWYTCANGHPFTVGECGMPMEQTRCPYCGSPIGGQHHQPAEGVRSLDEVAASMGNMHLGGGM